MRPLTDYQKIRSLIGRLRRNRGFQARAAALRPRDYLNAGCGPCVTAGFVNLDYRWVPGVDVVWDLSRPLPFPDARFNGIFSEHCLEHFDENALRPILREFHRVLRPGGRVRIVVPSLELHVRRYLEGRDRANDGAAAREFNRVFYSGHSDMAGSRWINDGHHFIHDFATFAENLVAVGFEHPAKCSLNTGEDPRLLIDRPDRAFESLYIEACKPRSIA